MPLSNIFSLIRGNLFEKVQDIAAPYVDKLLNTLAPRASFTDGFSQAYSGNINKSDNWGSFGTLLGNAVKAYTEPKDQTNAALPPTTGTVTDYAPAVIQAEPPVIEIAEKKYKNVSTRKLVKELQKRKAAQQKKKSPAPPKKVGVAKKTNAKTISANKKMVPKKKKKFTYAVDI